jgi:hypothetical protein
MVRHIVIPRANVVEWQTVEQLGEFVQFEMQLSDYCSVGTNEGANKKTPTEKTDKCLNLLERDTRFELATFSLGS